MKRSVKRCYLKQACFADDSADPVVLFLRAAVLVIDESSSISGRLMPNRPVTHRAVTGNQKSASASEVLWLSFFLN